MKQNLMIRRPFRIRHVQLMPHVIKNISKLHRVGSVRFHESFVSFKHEPLLLRVATFLLRGLVKFEFFRLTLDGGRTLHMEELIQSEATKQSGIALIHIDGAQTALAEFAQTKSDPGEGTHEGGIHLLAIAQIDHKIPVPALDHLLYKLLETRAILEGSAPFHLYPDGALNAADKDRRRRVHTGRRDYLSPVMAVKSVPFFSAT
jgi:hypothetical protein